MKRTIVTALLIFIILGIGVVAFINSEMFVQAKVNKAISLLQRKQLTRSREMFDRVLSVMPDHFPARYYSAECYSSLGNVELAIEEFEKASKLKSDDLDTLWNLVLLLFGSDRQQEAAKYAQLIIHLDQTDAFVPPESEQEQAQMRLKADFAHALHSFSESNWSRSAGSAAKVIQADENFTFANRLLGIDYYKMGLFEKSQYYIDRILQGKEIDPEAYLYKALLLINDNNWNMAYRYLDDAVIGDESLKREFLDEIRNMPVAEARMLSFADEVFIVKAKVKLDWDKLNLYYTLLYLNGPGERIRALAHDDLFLKKSEGRIDVRKLNLIYALSYFEKYDEVLELINAEIASQQDNLRGLHFLKGRIFQKLERPDEAVDEYLIELENGLHPKALFALNALLNVRKDKEIVATISASINKTYQQLFTASQMTSDVGKIYDNAYAVAQTGFVERTFDFPAADRDRPIVLGIVAKGFPGMGVYPLVDVMVDDNSVGRCYVNTDSFALYHIRFRNISGTHSVKLKFINNYWNPETQENRRVLFQSILLVEEFK